MKIERDERRRARFAADAAQADMGRVESTRLELLYELWLSVLSKLLFRLAGRVGWQDWARWTDLGSRALLTQADVEDFETEHGFEDPLDEIETWLRDRAYRNDLAAISGD
jgi:hypothetical protein